MYRDFVTGKLVAEPDDPPALDDAALGREVARRMLAFRRGLYDGFIGEGCYEEDALAQGLAMAYGTELIALLQKEANRG